MHEALGSITRGSRYKVVPAGWGNPAPGHGNSKAVHGGINTEEVAESHEAMEVAGMFKNMVV